MRACYGHSVALPEAALSAFVASARAEHPELDASSPAFLAHVAHHVESASGSPADVLAAIRPGDILLAWSCSIGDARAIKTFMQRYQDDVVRAARRVKSTGLDPEDLAQELARRIFGVQERQKAPKIAEYSGRGDLRAWVRIVVTRLALDATRVKRSTERPAEESAFRAIAASADAPELAYFKRLYRAEIRGAIEEAARALSADDREALREHYVHDKSIDEVAEDKKIHRATAARRIQRAREALILAVKRVLDERHGLEGRELTSVMNLVRSQMNVTMERILAD